MEAPPQLAVGTVKEIAELTNGPGTTQPVLQAADVRPVTLNGSAEGVQRLERFMMVVTDGVHSLRSMLSTSLNHLVRDGTLRPGSIVQLMDFVCNTIQGQRIIIVCELHVLRSEWAMIGKPKLYEMKSSRRGQESNLQANAVAPRVEQFANNLPYGGPSDCVYGTVGPSIGRTIEHGPNYVLSGGSYGTMSAQNTMSANVVQPNSQWPLLNCHQNQRFAVSRTEMSSPQKEELEALELILSDPSKEPVKLSYPTIKQMTEEFSNVIGRGGFGVVYLGTLPSGRIAVKKLSNAQDFDNTLFMDEINCLIGLKHKNIVRFLGYCADVDNKIIEYNGRHILVETRQRILCFEYVPNGDLYNYLKGEPNKDEWQMRYIMIKEICQGLQCIHGGRINHLDLKPENILMDSQMRPKISDFGLSRRFDEGQSRIFTKNLCGTRGYIAPEGIDKGEISMKSDIFSLGIIIIKLLTGRNNYDTENWDKSLDVDGPQAKSCIEIAQRCTHADQHKRPTVDEVVNKLNVMESMIQESREDTWPSIKQMDLNNPERMFLDENAEPMLDKTTSADETGMNGSLVELQVSLLKEQSDKERIGKLVERLKEEDINKRPETEDVAERLGNALEKLSITREIKYSP